MTVTTSVQKLPQSTPWRVRCQFLICLYFGVSRTLLSASVLTDSQNSMPMLSQSFCRINQTPSTSPKDHLAIQSIDSQAGTGTTDWQKYCKGLFQNIASNHGVLHYGKNTRASICNTTDYPEEGGLHFRVCFNVWSKNKRSIFSSIAVCG